MDWLNFFVGVYIGLAILETGWKCGKGADEGFLAVFSNAVALLILFLGFLWLGYAGIVFVYFLLLRFATAFDLILGMEYASSHNKAFYGYIVRRVKK